MTKEEFETTLTLAIEGDMNSIQSILKQYEPLINANSILNGVFDQDLKQYISLCIIQNIVKFNKDI